MLYNITVTQDVNAQSQTLYLFPPNNPINCTIKYQILYPMDGFKARNKSSTKNVINDHHYALKINITVRISIL